jgi:hypothetical protein
LQALQLRAEVALMFVNFLGGADLPLEHEYTLAEIGLEVGLHYATVSRVVKAFENNM